LEKRNLAQSIRSILLARDALPITDAKNAVGAGVYVIYYKGTVEEYAPLKAEMVEKSIEIPIYVGKAIPKGGRKGVVVTAPEDEEPAGKQKRKSKKIPLSPLAARIKKHVSSIESVSAFNVADFFVRYISLEDIWIPLCESALIQEFRPAWNVAVEGFGINDPGKGRSKQKRSPWDVLHPGRKYAKNLPEGSAVEAVRKRLADHFAGRPLTPLPKAVAEAADKAAEEDRGEV
jgi:hypothetical protein